MDLSQAANPVRIDLRPGTFSSFGDFINNVSIAYDMYATDPSLTWIERACGGGGNDSPSGIGGTNTLYGGAGDDTLVSGIHNDLLDGGAGLDVVSLAHANSGVTATVASGARVLPGLGTDTFLSIEGLIGSDCSSCSTKPSTLLSTKIA